MLKGLDKAIDEKNEKELENCIISLFNQSEPIDEAFYPRIEKVMLEKWHHQHEDIVNIIYLKDLKDNRFIIPIMEIAQKREIYRPYDDELESTLRKCVYALKTIGTDESNRAVQTLMQTGNENVKYALENYK